MRQIDFDNQAMCKLIAFAAAILIFISSVVGQVKSDREQAGFVGPVKSVRSFSFDYVGERIEGKQIQKKDGDFVEYDVAGREIARKPVSDFGEAMGQITRKYDDNGLLRESLWVDAKGKVIKGESFIYSDGRLTESLAYDVSARLIEKTVRSYDPSGRLSRETYFDPVKPVAKTVFKYRNNRLTDAAFFLVDDRPATAPLGPCLGGHRVTFGYNEKGQTIIKTIFDEDDNQKRLYRWEYDNEGNIVSYQSESPSSTITFVYKYENDTRGNWIKRSATGTSLQKGLDVFGKSPTPYVRSTVTKREISYF